MKFIKHLFINIVLAGSLLIPQLASAVCSNFYSYSDKETLTHTSLNNLQTHYCDEIDDVLDGNVLTGNMSWHSGVDALFYSDAGATQTAAIFGDSGKIYGAPQRIGVYGLNLNLTAGKLKIECNNAACSATNYGYVVMGSTTAGDNVTLRVDEDTHFFIDDSGASDIVGEQFGVTTGVAWGNHRPFFLYVAHSADADAGMVFGTSPKPNLTTTPVTANIGYHANPMATPSDNGMFFWTSTDVTVTHASKPVLLIGSFRMTMSASDDWTVSALNQTEGVGKYTNVSTGFTFPLAQMGAATGTHLQDNTGTAPVFSTQTYIYKIGLNGLVWVHFYLSADGGTDGAGAVTSKISLPYTHAEALEAYTASINLRNHDGSIVVKASPSVVASASNFVVYYPNITGGQLDDTLQGLTNDFFPNGASRFINGAFSYRAF